MDDYEIAHLRMSGLPSPTARLRASMGMHYALDAQTAWQRRPVFGDTRGEVEFARQAWSQPVFEPFRRFARLPLLHAVETAGGRRCAWFADQRFVVPGLPPSFRFGACENDDGRWTIERQRGLFIID
jgi:inner membrane protein